MTSDIPLPKKRQKIGGERELNLLEKAKSIIEREVEQEKFDLRQKVFEWRKSIDASIKQREEIYLSLIETNFHSQMETLQRGYKRDAFSQLAKEMEEEKEGIDGILKILHSSEFFNFDHIVLSEEIFALPKIVCHQDGKEEELSSLSIPILGCIQTSRQEKEKKRLTYLLQKAQFHCKETCSEFAVNFPDSSIARELNGNNLDAYCVFSPSPSFPIFVQQKRVGRTENKLLFPRPTNIPSIPKDGIIASAPKSWSGLFSVSSNRLVSDEKRSSASFFVVRSNEGEFQECYISKGFKLQWMGESIALEIETNGNSLQESTPFNIRNWSFIGDTPDKSVKNNLFYLNGKLKKFYWLDMNLKSPILRTVECQNLPNIASWCLRESGGLWFVSFSRKLGTCWTAVSLISVRNLPGNVIWMKEKQGWLYLIMSHSEKNEIEKEKKKLILRSYDIKILNTYQLPSPPYFPRCWELSSFWNPESDFCPSLEVSCEFSLVFVGSDNGVLQVFDFSGKEFKVRPCYKERGYHSFWVDYSRIWLWRNNEVVDQFDFTAWIRHIVLNLPE